MLTDSELEGTLRGLAAHLEVPSDPDLTAGVMRRISGEPGASSSRLRVWSGRTKLLLVGAGLVLAALLVSFAPPVRTAAAAVLDFVGIEIRPSDEGAAPPAPSPPTNAELGRAVPVADVSQEAGFVVPQPRTGEIGPPDEAYVMDGGDHQVVSLVWRRDKDIPVSSASDAALILSVFRGGPTRVEYLEKILFQGARAHRVQVNQNPGVFVDGPQTVVYLSSDREVEEEQSRLSGNSLIWQQGGLTLRLESALGQGASVEVAASVR